MDRIIGEIMGYVDICALKSIKNEEKTKIKYVFETLWKLKLLVKLLQKWMNFLK